MNAIQLHCVTVSGTPAIMGEMLGESLRDSIAGLVDHRLNNAASYLAERSIHGGMEAYRDAARA